MSIAIEVHSANIWGAPADDNLIGTSLGVKAGVLHPLRAALPKPNFYSVSVLPDREEGIIYR